jgi:hypothetical protein
MIVGPTNEIQQYIDVWYLKVIKGVNSLLSFKNHMEWSHVTWLVVHLPGHHNVIFNKNEDLATMDQRTTLTTYFAYNIQNADGRNVVYMDFHVDHIWKNWKKVSSTWK